ncbi:MAG: OsmC family protein [Lacibacter sp.]|jgi:putative redox protein
MALLTATNTHGDYGLTITDATGNSMQIDIPIAEGGTGKGIRPMHTMLAALMGCSSVDVVSILKKQRQSITALRMEVDGEREKENDFKLWRRIRLKVILDGDIDPAKAYRAADLSISKYCSVAETLRRAGASIEFSVIVNGNTYQP